MQVIAAVLGLAFVGLVGLTITFTRAGTGESGSILPTVLAGAGAVLCLVGIGLTQNRWRHARLDAASRRSHESADESPHPAADEHVDP